MATRTGVPVDAMTPVKGRSKPWHVLALLILTLLTALPPLLIVPPTTKSDETYHWAYATYVAQTGVLPPYLSPDDATSREAHQPPLYYSLAALLTRHLADPDAFANRVVNQFFLATPRGNRNFDILGPDAAQSFWIGRWLSLAFWLCVPLAALWAWRPILGARGSLTAAALIALTPLQAFVGTSYSNDMPSVAFMAVAVGALLRLLDPKRAAQWRWCVLLGVSLGLSMLSKLYALPLMGAIGVIAITPLLRLETRRRWQLLGALALAVVLMVPWMLDSYRRFGDPLGMSVFSQIMGRDPAWYRPSKIVNVTVQAWRTFWGDVGPGGIDAIPGWMAVGLAVMEVAALAGIVRWWRRAGRGSRHSTIALLLGLWALLALASFAWTFLRAQVTVISGGRNILYLQLVNAPLLVFGLTMWIKTERTVRAIVVGAGLVLTLWSWIYLATVYPIPQRELLTAPPAAAVARFGDQYALLDWQARSALGKVEVEFTLAKLKPDDIPWAYFLQIVTPDGKLLANINTYPAYGVLSTNYLPQGAVLHESYELPVTVPVPPGSRLLLGLWAPLAGGQRLPAFDAAGQPLPDSAYAMPWPPR
jgi:4-amino-4-deoxy-L-arabinose transferase-like glycosyltransferase